MGYLNDSSAFWALFGSPFPTTAYIGHPAYKRMGAHTGYIIGVGIVIPLAAFFGLLAFLSNMIPLAAAAPILVFVAISLISNTAASVASMIDGHFKNAGSFALAGAVMSSVGIVHAGALQMPELNGIVGGYLIMGVVLIAYPIWGKVESLSQDTSQS